MSKTNTGGPAFSRAGNEWYEMEWHKAPAEEGMTLRDYFAAKAMQVFLTNKDSTTTHDATAAYLMADLMLKAREA